MSKGKFPEVRSVIEFDRLASHHLADAYTHLVPTPKRLMRSSIKKPKENQTDLQVQVRQRKTA